MDYNRLQQFITDYMADYRAIYIQLEMRFRSRTK